MEAIEKTSLLAARCLDCGYSLRGLPESRCPECGRRFDPDDPVTFDTGRPMWRSMRWFVQPTGFVRPLVWIATSLMICAGSTPGMDDRFLLASLLLWVGIVAFWIYRSLARRIMVRVYKSSAAGRPVDAPARR